jgi:hypothetical protein
MSALVIPRGDDERLCMSADGDRGLEITVERRAADGWQVVSRVHVRRSELGRLSGAVLAEICRKAAR